MLPEIDTVKGFSDILPPESLKQEAVKKVIERQFQLHGFLPLETPVIEFDELMRSDALGAQDEAVSDRFRLKDRAGRNLGLRYEFTFQLARIFKQNPNLKLPFKRYQIGPLFRDEPIGPGRFRQFTQCDADIVGDSSVNADVECLALVAEVLSALQIEEAQIHVNNRKLLTAIVESVQISDVSSVMRELDKIDKIGEDVVKFNLKKYADANQVLTLFKLLEKDLPFFKENAFDGAKELDELRKRCKLYGIKIKFDPFLIRGLSYYTGSIFEIKEPGKSSIAAGGRYDKVVGKYLNRELPAVGISFGLERMTQIAKIASLQVPQVMIISIDQDIDAIGCAKRLRAQDITCSLSFDKIGKAMEYANAYQIPFVVFLGSDEVKKNKLKLKDMKSGEETLISEKQLIKKLQDSQSG